MKAHSLHITPEILALVAELDEFKGAWLALGRLTPAQLEGLKRLAMTESIGASIRLDGGRLSDKEVRDLLSDRLHGRFSTKEQQEAVGYADVLHLLYQDGYQAGMSDLQTIARDLQAAPRGPLNDHLIREGHALLLQYSEKDAWHRGGYKRLPIRRGSLSREEKSQGLSIDTASPAETPVRMERLLKWLNESQHHPLVTIALFLAEFLAIQPFQDGTGHMSRILSTYLLLRNNYAYVPYASLEAVIEENKEEYSHSLRRTQGTMKSRSPDWQPWVVFFLRALQRHKRRLEEKLEREKLLALQLPGLSLEILETVKLRGRITVREAVALTEANRNTVKKHLEGLVGKNYLKRQGEGKGSWYSL